ncbi:ROK family transcriptional regulator [Rarobacter faecitabidus]|uniref:Putative NBD/HSP70 family sugar kinase n=1 Tax=Rarobacter faecitabidus TaxID=13243 RepID=A0A542ZXE3_RARFA|nr:ROK family transcriptional regulator [Rarobacter faecitabidus]TQL64880.1 putative NBD/HSP70 family sugar kinase [Rarobacter faecitabidus]
MTKVTHDSTQFELSPVDEASRAARAARRNRLRTKSLPGDSRWHNRTLVLQTLYRQGPISRADVARATKLTKATVSDLVSGLMVERLVRTLGTQESSGPGKPAVLIDIARQSHAVVCLDLSDHRILRGAVFDLSGGILHSSEVPLTTERGREATELAARLANQLASHTTVPILGLGVGTPGVVDDLGTVRTAPNLGWKDEPLEDLLEELTGIPTVVANDANAAALAEHSADEASDDLMLIAIGHGLGSGIIVDGQLVPGSRFAAGEIGQVMVGTDLGLDAPYSRDQVLEHWLSVPNLTAALAAAGEQGREAVLREAGQRLGVALAPVVGALNLTEVVIAGPEELVQGTLTDAALEIVRRRTMPDSHDTLTIRSSSQGRDLVLRGAAALVLQDRLGVS